MSSNIFRIGQNVRFKQPNDRGWSAGYVVRGVTANGLMLAVSTESKHLFTVPFENHEFQTSEPQEATS